ncbi:MAG: SPOR domain-containing protein [Bacteroidales bacterium]|nr:SPOR domain-containing protein [Candidatus Colicola coprequi]
MKHISTIILCLLGMSVWAQTPAPTPADTLATDTTNLPVELPYPAILQDMSPARVYQDSMITLLMQEKITGIERGQTEISGWRVQIYSSNNQSDAKAGALAIQQQLNGQLSVGIYVLYTPPFWKVRVGDFRTMEEAQQYKQLFIESYPDLQATTYVVRDEHVQIKK